MQDRTVERLAARFGLEERLEEALSAGATEPASGPEETARVMRLFEGIPEDEFAEACREHRLRPGAREAIAALQQMGFRIGIVSASYYDAAEAVRSAVGADFAVAVEPEVRDGKLTGKVVASPFHGACGTYLCKERVLDAYRTENTGVTVAVGDGHNDRCMLRAADLGIAVEPCPMEVRLVADVVVRDLRAIPAVVQKRLSFPLLATR